MCYQCRNRRKIPASIEIQHIHFAYVHRTSTYMYVHSCTPNGACENDQASRRWPQKYYNRRQSRRALEDALRHASRSLSSIFVYCLRTFFVSRSFYNVRFCFTPFSSLVILNDSPRRRSVDDPYIVYMYIYTSRWIQYAGPIFSDGNRIADQKNDDASMPDVWHRHKHSCCVKPPRPWTWPRTRGSTYGKKRGPIEKKDENNVEGSMEVHSAKTRGV